MYNDEFHHYKIPEENRKVYDIIIFFIYMAERVSIELVRVIDDFPVMDGLPVPERRQVPSSPLPFGKDSTPIGEPGVTSDGDRVDFLAVNPSGGGEQLVYVSTRLGVTGQMYPRAQIEALGNGAFSMGMNELRGAVSRTPLRELVQGDQLVPSTGMAGSRSNGTR